MNYEEILRRTRSVPIRSLGQGAYGRKENCIFLLNYISNIIAWDYSILSTEYANLKTLDIIAKQRSVHLSMYLFRALAKQILEGMSVFHYSGLIHRDIKCDNILLHSPPGSGRVYAKISDFGFAKKEDSINEQTYLRGFAPELFKKPRIVTQKSDMYSVGITFYHLITHQYPVYKNNVEDQQKKIAQMNSITRPSEITNNLQWDLLSKLLEFDPEKRISASKALLHPFFTSSEATNDISFEQRQIAQQAKDAQMNGDCFITKYDINPSFILPEVEIKKILK
ncbi:MAG: hypothetical protein EZS28_035034 [Streblomastix strix]|uniref:Protein kinase domain-containing protein n=1 Tax=Streblomastix strix TaxID=222440 RepID=A0A5J4UFR0_9EUKA|nr:MAG: hypothetical protein EZS28_035034 [Streblomastix strix]